MSDEHHRAEPTADEAADHEPTGEADEEASPPPVPTSHASTTALEDQLRRALADLDNLRKRYQREATRERLAERSRVAAEWIPVVDNLERALQHAGNGDAALIEGVQAVRDQAVAAFERLGFPRYDDIGQPFDPARHEAVGTIVSDAPPGTVVAAIRPGYGSGDDILRPALVMVAKEPDD
ncbi:MAG TPA: nucleotide exchange factor GrpE [Acidimicrobiales bacterium]|nr:nucleotide exchange factor GrpE [Acidimicrobiales bacterium]